MSAVTVPFRENSRSLGGLRIPEASFASLLRDRQAIVRSGAQAWEELAGAGRAQ